jgi:hypothetical protein
MEAPPTYDSLYGELREVRDPRGFASFFVKALNIIIGTAVATICLAIVNIIPIAMIVIGSIHLQDCPAEQYIPIWLIIMGAVSIFKSLLNCLYRAKRKFTGEEAPNDENANVKPNPFDGLISCFLLAWFIAGTVWVYRTHPTFVTPKSPMYCDELTYKFTYWLITVMYIFCLLFMLFTCCCGCCAILFGRRTSSTPRNVA